MRISKPWSELTESEKTHLEVVGRLEKLDNLKPFVVLGFIIFWGLWLLACIWAFGHYTGLYW